MMRRWFGSLVDVLQTIQKCLGLLYLGLETSSMPRCFTAMILEHKIPKNLGCRH